MLLSFALPPLFFTLLALSPVALLGLALIALHVILISNQGVLRPVCSVSLLILVIHCHKDNHNRHLRHHDDGGKTQVRQPSLSTHVLSLVFWLLPPFTLSRHHLFFVFVFTSSPHPCIVTSAFFFLSPSTFNIAIIPLIIVTILSCLSKHLLCYEASWSNSFLGHLSQVSQVLTCNLVVECFCKLEHIGFYSTHCNNCGKKFQTRGSTDLHLHWRCLRQRQPLHWALHLWPGDSQPA